MHAKQPANLNVHVQVPDTNNWCLADSTPLPLTPDYGGPQVSYADGVFDSRFNRYVTVQEGKNSRKCCSSITSFLIYSTLYVVYKLLITWQIVVTVL